MSGGQPVCGADAERALTRRRTAGSPPRGAPEPVLEVSKCPEGPVHIVRVRAFSPRPGGEGVEGSAARADAPRPPTLGARCGCPGGVLPRSSRGDTESTFRVRAYVRMRSITNNKFQRRISWLPQR